MLPGAIGRSSRRIKPSGTPDLDWTRKPRGLQACCVFDGARFVEVVAGIAVIAANGGGFLEVGAAPTPIGAGATFGNSTAASIPVTQPNLYSIEAICVTGPSSTGNFIVGWNNQSNGLGGAFDRAIGINGAGIIVGYTYNGAPTIVTGPLVKNNATYHLVITEDGTNLNLYVNGALAASTPATGGYDGYTTPWMTIGFGAIDGFSAIEFGGQILLAQYANVAWTASEVAARYADQFGHLIFPQDYVFAALAAATSSSVSVNLTGVAGVGAVASFTPTISPSLVAAAATGAVASLTPSVARSLGAVAATGAVEPFTASLGKTLGDATAIGAVAGLTPSVGPSLGPIVAGIGNAEPFLFNPQLSGVAGTGKAESFVPTIAVPLAAVSSTGSVEAFTPSPGAILAAVAGTGTVEPFGLGGALGLGGVAGNGAAGAGSIQIQVAFGAVSGIGDVERFELNPQLLGVAGVGAADAFAASIGHGLTGVAGTAAAEAFAPGISYVFGAVSASGAAEKFLANQQVELGSATGIGTSESFAPNPEPLFSGVTGTSAVAPIGVSVSALPLGAEGVGTGAPFAGWIEIGAADAAAIGAAASLTNDSPELGVAAGVGIAASLGIVSEIVLAGVAGIGTVALFTPTLFKPLNPTFAFTRIAPRWIYVTQAEPLQYVSRLPRLPYIALIPENDMPSLNNLPPIDAVIGDQVIGLDFGRFLPPGVTAIGTPTLTITDARGVDQNPASRIVSGPQVGTASVFQGGTGIPNVAILAEIANPVGGAFYLLVGSCKRSDQGSISGYTHLPCVTPA